MNFLKNLFKANQKSEVSAHSMRVNKATPKASPKANEVKAHSLRVNKATPKVTPKVNPKAD